MSHLKQMSSFKSSYFFIEFLRREYNAFTLLKKIFF